MKDSPEPLRIILTYVIRIGRPIFITCVRIAHFHLPNGAE